MGLTGPVAAIRQMAQEYRVYFKKDYEEGDDYLVQSSHNMYTSISFLCANLCVPFPFIFPSVF